MRIHGTTCLALVTALLVSTGSSRAGEPAANDGRKDFRVTYRTTVPLPSTKAGRIEVWVPVPLVNAVQEVRDLAVRANAPFELRVDAATGNRMVHVAVEKPARPVEITWTAVVRRQVEAGQERAPGADSGTFLEGDRLAPIDAGVRKLVAELGADAKEATAEARARRIWDYVQQHTAYDKSEPGWGLGDYERVCRVGKGNCSDFTARFVTLARAAGLPARWVSTIALSEEHAACGACGYHCYGYYQAGDRWIPVDPADAWRSRATDAAKAEWYFGHAARSNVILSVGRDLTLTPAQQAGPVNFLSGPYVEVDGRPVALAAADRSYEAESLEPGTAAAAPTTQGK